MAFGVVGFFKQKDDKVVSHNNHAYKKVSDVQVARATYSEKLGDTNSYNRLFD